MARVSANDSLPVRTQFLIFTVFGEYILDYGEQIWTSSLLELMGALEISERAVRSTLSRLSRKGWVTSRLYGRRSKYTLTARGKALLEGGRQRIYEPIFTDWDGQWQLVVYSLPEKKRRKRHALRKQLTWLGFGRLAPGTWLSPHKRRIELKELLTDLDAEEYVDLFSGLYLGPSTTEEMVRRCWDFEALEDQYKAFIQRYRPAYLQNAQPENGHQPLSPRDSFIRRFWLTQEYQSFPQKDPNLPDVLLSPSWVGFEARKLYEDYHRLLGARANQYVKRVMSAGEEAAK